MEKDIKTQADFSSFTVEEMCEEYLLLQKRYNDLVKTSETDAQKIYELKKHLDTAIAGQDYLSQELANTLATFQDVECLKNVQKDMKELSHKYEEKKNENSVLRQENINLTQEVTQLQQELKTNATFVRKQQEVIKNDVGDDDKLAKLEVENMELLEKLEENNERNVRQIIEVAEREKKIEILSNQVTCLEENLRFKREEVEEKSLLLESTQEQLAETNAKLAMLTSAPDTNNRKGNSLFAEVDDQRQAMKQLLAAQKKSYLDMKKIYDQSQYEIRRLKRENMAMHTELRECTSIFHAADKTYQQKLNQRIGQLITQNEELARKLKWTQDRLSDLAKEKGVDWLDSMLNFCKQETEEFKRQLHSISIQNAGLEEQLRNVTQEMARWRFESLKSRCILIDRENLLNTHNINFAPVKTLKFNISENDIQIATPRIMEIMTPNIADIPKSRYDGEEVSVSVKKLTEVASESEKLETKHESNNPNLENNDTTSESIVAAKEICATIPIIEHNEKQNLVLNTADDDDDDEDDDLSSDELKISKRIEKITGFSPRILKSKHLNSTETLPKLAGILQPKRDETAMLDIIEHDDDEHKKSVKFSTEEPVIHLLTPAQKQKQKPMNNADGVIVKEVRNKSVVIRHVYIKSKKNNNKNENN